MTSLETVLCEACADFRGLGETSSALEMGTTVIAARCRDCGTIVGTNGLQEPTYGHRARARIFGGDLGPRPERRVCEVCGCRFRASMFSLEPILCPNGETMTLRRNYERLIAIEEGR